MIRSVLVLLLLAGCTTWTKPGATEADLRADQTACDTEAQKNFPPTLGAPSAAGMTAAPPTMSCVPNRGCVPTNGAYLPPPTAVDLNQGARDQAVNECMTKRGWSQ